MKWLPWIASVLLASSPAIASAQSVVTYHNAPDRSGLYVVPGLTMAAAGNMHLDTGFKATVSGHVYAQPLYWQAPGKKFGALIVTTESNLVYALNPNTGAVEWKTQLATAAPQNTLGCGNIDPEGITGTPVIDDGAGVLYIDAMTVTSNNVPRQMIYALNASTGKVLPHWPLDVEAGMRARKVPFDSKIQGERSALQFFKNKLYINYAGRFGDCGAYHGAVVEVTPSATPSITGSWKTRAKGGGIWSQGGVATDGTSLFTTTGNTFGANIWGDGEAVVRLLPGLARSTNAKDFFTPSNWKDLDNQDLDLGGTEALPFTIPAATGDGTLSRVLALGKDGKAYLLNGANLGGIGRQLQALQISNNVIITEPAIYNAKTDTLIAFTNYSGAVSNCSGNNLTMLKVTSNAGNPLTVAWCAPISGGGSPIITTTNGTANPIAWVVGAEGDNQLHGFNALTGNSVFTSATTMNGLRHLSTIMAANHHLYVAADGTVYAFAFGQ